MEANKEYKSLLKPVFVRAIMVRVSTDHKNTLENYLAHTYDHIINDGRQVLEDFFNTQVLHLPCLFQLKDKSKHP